MAKEIKLDKVIRIVELTKKEAFRPDIARELDLSVSTVYKYQKQFNLV